MPHELQRGDIVQVKRRQFRITLVERGGDVLDGVMLETRERVWSEPTRLRLFGNPVLLLARDGTLKPTAVAAREDQRGSRSDPP